MDYKDQIRDLLEKVIVRAAQARKFAGFVIGNTAKHRGQDLYLTPLRETELMVSAGVIVYSEEQAAAVADIVDGHVDYVLVDAEKKIPHPHTPGELANVERTVREHVRRSRLWTYKGNDLSVDAVDGLLAHLTREDKRGLGGRKVCILGAGNIGFKLALRLVERGAQVVITRRNEEALSICVQALNLVKPDYTQAQVIGMTDNWAAARGAHILIGASQGVPLITAEMVQALAKEAVIVDVGKGVLFPEAAAAAAKIGVPVYRLDVSAAFEGLIHRLRAMECLLENRMGRRTFEGHTLVSGGLLGGAEEIVVDNAFEPTSIYGIADGKGDFIRQLSAEQLRILQRLQQSIDQSRQGEDTGDIRRSPVPVEEAGS